MKIPKLSNLSQLNTSRLVSSKKEKDALKRITSNNDDLNNILDLDGITNKGLLAENGRLPGISAFELVSGFNYYDVVNNAYCYTRPEGSRFNGPDRGAWYASFARTTALKEIIFHKTLDLAEHGHFFDDVTYDIYLVDFHYKFHDIRSSSQFKNCLDKKDYRESQKLAQSLLINEKSAGIVYPSARHEIGTNIVCFRPALVTNVRKDGKYKIVWDGTDKPKSTYTAKK